MGTAYCYPDACPFLWEECGFFSPSLEMQCWTVAGLNQREAC